MTTLANEDSKWSSLCTDYEGNPVDATSPSKSEHQLAVEKFHDGIGLTTPSEPVVPTDDKLTSRCMLLLEEVLEFVDACGVEIHTRVPTPESDWQQWKNMRTEFKDLTFYKTSAAKADLVGMADGLADTMVICAGGLAVCGIDDIPLLREVDNNNLLKISTGHLDEVTGKFIKAPNHPKPDIAGVLKAQGWTND